MRTPVFCSIVFTSSFGPPYAKAALILVVPWPGIGDQGVARDREQQVRLPAAGVQQHDRVGALADVADAAGAELLLLGLGQALAAVGADEQVRRTGLVGGAAAAGVGVDLVDRAPGPARAPRPGRRSRRRAASSMNRRAVHSAPAAQGPHRLRRLLRRPPGRRAAAVRRLDRLRRRSEPTRVAARRSHPVGSILVRLGVIGAARPGYVDAAGASGVRRGPCRRASRTPGFLGVVRHGASCRRVHAARPRPREVDGRPRYSTSARRSVRTSRSGRRRAVDRCDACDW